MTHKDRETIYLLLLIIVMHQRYGSQVSVTINEDVTFVYDWKDSAISFLRVVLIYHQITTTLCFESVYY